MLEQTRCSPDRGSLRTEAQIAFRKAQLPINLVESLIKMTCRCSCEGPVPSALAAYVRKDDIDKSSKVEHDDEPIVRLAYFPKEETTDCMFWNLLPSENCTHPGYRVDLSVTAIRVALGPTARDQVIVRLCLIGSLLSLCSTSFWLLEHRDSPSPRPGIEA